MLDRYGIDERERRKVLIVVGVMTVIMAVLVDGPILVRVVAGATLALASGVAFLVVTVLLDRFGPDY